MCIYCEKRPMWQGLADSIGTLLVGHMAMLEADRMPGPVRLAWQHAVLKAFVVHIEKELDSVATEMSKALELPEIREAMHGAITTALLKHMDRGAEAGVIPASKSWLNS